MVRLIGAFAHLNRKGQYGSEKTNQQPYINDEGFVDFAEGDPENPRNWSRIRRSCITAYVVLLVMNGSLAASIPAGCLESLASAFHVSKVAANLTLTLFALAYCGGPFFFAPLSEVYGRRWIIYTTLLVYAAFNFLTTFAPNFASMLIGRFLAGTFVAPIMSVAPAIVADLWVPYPRDNAIAIIAVAIWAGPFVAPVASAFLDQAKGWKWGFYLVHCLNALTILLLSTLPETNPDTILVTKAKRIRQLSIPGYAHVKAMREAKGIPLVQEYKEALLRPWILLFDLTSFLCTIYLIVVFTLQYMLFSIYPIMFQQVRGWTATTAQLPMLGALVGAFVGAGLIFWDTSSRKKLDIREKRPVPEDYLGMAMLGGIGFPITALLFAWTGHYGSIHWAVPTLAGCLLSTSLYLVYVAYTNYIIASYGENAASLFAINTFARSAGSAAAPLFTTQMFNTLGVGRGGSLIGGVAVLLAIIPFLSYRYGRVSRIKSKYAPTSTESGEDQVMHPIAE